MKANLLDVKGCRITNEHIRTGLRLNIFAGGLGMMYVALALGMPMIMFMERLGASAVAIGLVVTVQLLAMTMQVPSALLAERLTNRKRYWAVVSLLHRLIWFLPPLLPLFIAGPLAGWVMLMLIMVSSLLANASAAPWFSWLADLIPEKQRNRFWSRRQSVTQGAFLLAMGLGGWILDRFSGSRATGSDMLGFSLVFILAAILGTVDILIHMLVPEPKPEPLATGESFRKRILRPFADADFIWLTMAFGAWNFGLGMIGSFAFLYLRRSFEASYSQLAAFTVCSSIGTIFASLVWGKVMDYVGERTFAIGILCVAPLFALQWFLLTDGMLSFTLPWLGQLTLPAAILQICLLSIISGGLYTGVPLSQIVLASAVTRKEGRTLAMAVHWTLVGGLSALGPVVGGLIMDWSGSRQFRLRTLVGQPIEGFHFLVLTHMLISWLVALPLLSRIRPRHGNLPTRALVCNPLRAIGLIQVLITLGEASSWQSRARAVRKLGSHRISHLVSALVEQLSDPSAAVRQEAIHALGRIGSNPAVDELLEVLADPDSDLAPQAARALGKAPDSRPVSGLIQGLSSSEPEVRKESARSLGEIGDQQAIGPLTELVESSRDLRLVVAASEALVHLGATNSVPSMVLRLADFRNPILRASMAVAVADLLGKPGQFYPILNRERRHEGSEISAMLRIIRNSVRRSNQRIHPSELSDLRNLVDQAEEYMLDNQLREAAHKLFELAMVLAAMRWGPRSRPGMNNLDPEQLNCPDPGFALGLSYLDRLRKTIPPEPFSPVVKTELLIGIYFLFHWVGRWSSKNTGSGDS